MGESSWLLVLIMLYLIEPVFIYFREGFARLQNFTEVAIPGVSPFIDSLVVLSHSWFTINLWNITLRSDLNCFFLLISNLILWGSKVQDREELEVQKLIDILQREFALINASAFEYNLLQYSAKERTRLDVPTYPLIQITPSFEKYPFSVKPCDLSTVILIGPVPFLLLETSFKNLNHSYVSVKNVMRKPKCLYMIH